MSKQTLLVVIVKFDIDGVLFKLRVDKLEISLTRREAFSSLLGRFRFKFMTFASSIDNLSQIIKFRSSILGKSKKFTPHLKISQDKVARRLRDRS